MDELRLFYTFCFLYNKFSCLFISRFDNLIFERSNQAGLIFIHVDGENPWIFAKVRKHGILLLSFFEKWLNWYLKVWNNRLQLLGNTTWFRNISKDEPCKMSKRSSCFRKI